MGERIIYPRRRKSMNSFLQPVTDGTPITVETAKSLRQTLFGSSMHSGSQDWFKTAFIYQKRDSPFPYGLLASKNNTKAVLMCVQAYILKHLLFHARSGSVSPSSGKAEENRDMLKASEAKLQDSLNHALANIIWRCGAEKGRAIVCLPAEKAFLEKDHNYYPDGLTEKLMLFEFTRHEDVYHCVSKYQYLFQQETRPGVMIFLYSAVMSRGIESLMDDMQDEYTQLITPLGECTLSIVILLLTGRATPYLHNGTIYVGSEATMAKPHVGILSRADVGFLAWRRTDSSIRQVGSRLKTPLVPIWVTCADDQYGVLFNPNRDLVRDHRAEHRFDLNYYNSASNQTIPIILSLDTRYNQDVEYGTPALEMVIFSKWQGAKVNWNGSAPLA